MLGLFKPLLFAFLPLIVFVVADSALPQPWGIIVAVVWAIGELLFTYSKEKRWDGILLADTALLSIMGGVSLILQSELLFKLKPAVFEGVFALYMIALVLLPGNVVQKWTSRYMKQFSPDMNVVKRLFIGMSAFFLLHAAVIAYTAIYSDKKTWLFVNGVLLYIIMGVFIVAIVIKRVFKRTTQEYFPILDENGAIIGKATREHCHGGSFALHPVVHLHLFDNDGRLLLQKRSMSKNIQPGKWDTSVGGHISFGETVDQALVRECKEEIGFMPKNARLVYKYRMKSSVEEEMVFTFSAVYENETVKVQKTEIDEARFYTAKEILALIETGETTENFVLEFQLLRKNMMI